MPSIQIMLKDTIVADIDFNDARFDVLLPELLPYQLRGRLRKLPEFTTESAKYQATQMFVVNSNNNEAFIDWLAGRTLALSRKNAKWLYNLIRMPQTQDARSRAKVSLVCRAVSLLDNYWVRTEREASLNWSDIDLRTNSLNDIVTQVALHGDSLSLEGSLTTPEFTTNGAYAKGWRRYPDGSLWLHKLGADGNYESRIEVMCSDLLDKMNVDHVHYEMTTDADKDVCACPCMTTEDLSILPGMDFVSYCQVNGLDADSEMMKIDAESIHKMAIVDYLISNRDRHGQNWGFYFDASTTKIVKCHPLFDHNNAFDIATMQNRDATYVFSKDNSMTIRRAALNAIKHVDFHFTKPITKDDFITTRQYDSFMKRAEELHIETIVEQDSWSRYVTKYGIQDEARELHRLSGVYHTKNIDIIKERVVKDFL